jgi:hypothetical protein
LSTTYTWRINEDFRILILEYLLNEDVRSFIKERGALASRFYWRMRLRLELTREAFEKMWLSGSDYWRRRIVDPRDPMCLLEDVEETPRPRKVIINLSPTDALHENKGAYIKGGMLLLRLNRGLEAPEGALKWFERKIAEKPDKKYVKGFEGMAD